MTTASVACLPSDEDARVQHMRVDRGRQLYAALTDFPALTSAPSEAAAVSSLPMDPVEGWLVPSTLVWRSDPLAVGRLYHDVIPDGGVTRRAQASHMAARLRGALSEAGYAGTAESLAGRRLCHVFSVGPPDATMAVTVVNIVHTSYCQLGRDDHAMDAEISEAPVHEERDEEDEDEGGARVIFSQAFLWRRLLHLGPQRNCVHTSLKLSYMPPFNASHILFQTGRILETGANNLAMARVMFYHVTLPHLRAAGLVGLGAVTRSRQNIVATSAMPNRRGLSLETLFWRSNQFVSYNRRKFTGAIVSVNDPTRPRRPRRQRAGRRALTGTGKDDKQPSMLVFGPGRIVSVGSSSYEELMADFVFMYPTLMLNSTEPPAPGQGGRAPGHHRQRRRRRAQPDALLLPPPAKRRRLDTV